MKRRQPARGHDQTTVAGARESRDRTLDLSRVTHIHRSRFNAERARRSLNGAELAGPGASGSRMTAARVTAGVTSLSSSSHFAPMLYSKLVKPVALPPGRARLST